MLRIADADAPPSPSPDIELNTRHPYGTVACDSKQLCNIHTQEINQPSQQVFFGNYKNEYGHD